MTFDLHSDLDITLFAGQGSLLIRYSQCGMIKGSHIAIFVCYTSSIAEMYRKTATKAILLTFDLHSDLEITPFVRQGSPLI